MNMNHLIKKIPFSIEAEQMVLACILLDSNSYITIADKLQSKCFYRVEHQIIYEQMKQIYHSKKAIDAITLSANLQLIDQLTFIGGHDYINSLVEATSSAAHIESYANIIIELSQLRTIINTCSNLSNDCYEPNGKNIDEILTKYLPSLTNIVQVDEPISYLSDIIDIIQNKVEVSYIKTNQQTLDIQLGGGFGRGEFIVLAGKSGMGKTSTALNLFANLIKTSKCIFFSLEMQTHEIALRLRNYFANCNSENMNREQSDNLIENLALSKHLAIVHVPTLTVNLIRRYILNYQIKHQQLDVVFIDYLQLMKRQPKQSEYEAITQLTRELKILAQEMNITIIGISQLNRSGADKKDTRPYMTELRGSGSLEQDADFIFFVHREQYYYDEIGQAVPSEIKNKLEFIAAKCRRKPPFKILYNCNLETGRLGDCEYGEKQKYTEFFNKQKMGNK